MESTLERNYGPAIGWNTIEGNQPRPPALHVILHKREYILPWSRLLCAEGANAEVVVSFATHEVVVTGYGLDHLLADIGTPTCYIPPRTSSGGQIPRRHRTATKGWHPSNFGSADRGGIAQWFPRPAAAALFIE